MPDEPVKMFDTAADPDTIWKTWKAGSGPEINANALKLLEPSIAKAARGQTGDYNPLIQSKARRLALKALQTYNPRAGTQFRSHLYNHMQGLKRYAGQVGAAVQVPERLLLDRRTLEGAAKELADELGREATDTELADRTGFSLKRLARIRTYKPPMSQGFFTNLGEANEGDGYDPAVQGPQSTAWLQIVADELNPMDQKILEWGLAGVPNQEIAKRLRRSPGLISQRKLAIQKKLDQEQDLSPFGA